MEKSLWQKDNNLKDLDSVNSNISADILIIGAGITGVTTAYNLINSGLNVILIDRGKCFNEVTAKSTGKITYLQDLKYQDICNIYNYETAKLYYDTQKEAIKIIKKNIKDNEINCDFEKSESVTFTTDEKKIPKFIAEENLLKSFGVKYSNNCDLIDDNKIKHLISVKNTYVFNPVKYLKGLLKVVKSANNIKVYENSIATKVRKDAKSYTVMVNNFEVKAKKIVVACNYPFFTIPGFIPLKTYLKRSYITATKVDDHEKINGITGTSPVISFRFYEEKNNKYFIYLSNTSKISNKLNHEKNNEETIIESKKITGKFPSYKWMNMDVMTNDFLPIIGKVSDEDSNVFIATGYNAWGMTNGTIAGKIIFDLIRKKQNKYTNLFSPSRVLNAKKIKNFAINTLGSNAKAYLLNIIKKNPSWYKDKVIVTKENKKRIGIYFDKDGRSHKVLNVCPHLKCFLNFNMVDKTWDCPCHGSRFNIDGKAVKGPSQYDIKIDETK